MSNMKEKAEDYVPLNTRLQTLKTRLDVPEYNEQQRLLFPKDCEELTKDVYKKVCRFITDCEVPSTDLCLVAINYKETMPPSHPREALPINLLAELQTCCEPGRIACPELIMYSIEPERSVERMMLYDKENIGLGDLKIGIDFKNRTHCCESEDSWEEGLESIDFIEILPSIQLDFNCDMGSIEFSREYYESIELCYRRLEFLRKYHIWMDICNQDMSFEAILEPVVEKCLACDASYEISKETSVEIPGGRLNVKLQKNVNIEWCEPEFSEEISIEVTRECDEPKRYTGGSSSYTNIYGAQLQCSLAEAIDVDWCSGEMHLDPGITVNCQCNEVTGRPSLFPINIEIPPCSQSVKDGGIKIKGVGTVTNTLSPNGEVSSNVNVNNVTVSGRLGESASIGVVTNVSVQGTKLLVSGRSIIFTDGIYCGATPVLTETFDIGDAIIKNIDCRALRKKCNLCECSDSESSSSSSTSSSESGSDTSSNCWTVHAELDGSYTMIGAVVTVKGTGEQKNVTMHEVGSDGSFIVYEGTIRSDEELEYTCQIMYSTGSGYSTTTGFVTKGGDCQEVEPSNSSSSASDYSASSSSSTSGPCTGELSGTVSIALYNDLPKPVLATYTINGEQYTTAATATPADSEHVLLTINAVGTEEDIRSITAILVTPTTDGVPRSIPVELDENSIDCGGGSTSDSSSSAEPKCTMQYELRLPARSFDSDSSGKIVPVSRTVYWNLSNNPLMGKPWGPVDALLQSDTPDAQDNYVYLFTVTGTAEDLNNIDSCQMPGSNVGYTVSPVGSMTCE